MANKKLSIDEVEALVKNVLIREDSTTVQSVEPSCSGDYCSVILDGDVMLETLRVLAKAVGDEPIIGGEAVGGDGRKYKIEPDDLLTIGSSICVRATCIETGRNDAYDLYFFV